MHNLQVLKRKLKMQKKQLEAAPLEDAVKEAQKAELLKQKQALEASQKKLKLSLNKQELK